MVDWIDEAAKDVCKLERRIFGGQAHCHEMTDVIAKAIREAYQRHVSDPKPINMQYTAPPPNWARLPQPGAPEGIEQQPVTDKAYQRQVGDTASAGPLSDGPLFWRNQPVPDKAAELLSGHQGTHPIIAMLLDAEANGVKRNE